MSSRIDPDDVGVRTARHWSENGFDELTVGLLLSVLGGLYPYALLKVALLGPNYAMVGPLLLAALTLPFVLITKRVREHVIFPRTGYVVFRPMIPRGWILVVFGGLGIAQAAALAYWGFRWHDLGRLAGPAMGLLFSTIFLWGGIANKLPQYLWLAVLSLLLGVLSVLAGLKIEGSMLVMVGSGVAMAVDGAFRMRRFLRTHPLQEDHHA